MQNAEAVDGDTRRGNAIADRAGCNATVRSAVANHVHHLTRWRVWNVAEQCQRCEQHFSPAGRCGPCCRPVRAEPRAAASEAIRMITACAIGATVLQLLDQTFRERGAALHARQLLLELSRNCLGADLINHRVSYHDRPGRLAGSSLWSAKWQWPRHVRTRMSLFWLMPASETPSWPDTNQTATLDRVRRCQYSRACFPRPLFATGCHVQTVGRSVV